MGLASSRLVLIDCRSAGISGDMLLAALIDLGADASKISSAIEPIPNHFRKCKRVAFSVQEVKRASFRAKQVAFSFDEEPGEARGHELVEAVAGCVRDLDLSDKARSLAEKSVRTLVKAEAKLHGVAPDEVRLHEAGSTDTVADIVGVAVALEDLLLLEDAEIYSTPVAVGGGYLEFSHGVVSNPPPAVMEILKDAGFPLIGGPIEGELTTPTGAAILTNLASKVSYHYPAMKPEAVGYGAGAKDYPRVPNITRVVVGEALTGGLLQDEILVLETNLDDVTGEVLGHAVQRLIGLGAKDACIIPMYTKKNRPGFILQVLTDGDRAEELSRAIIEETGTLGVRRYTCARFVLDRGMIPMQVELRGVKRTINVKVATDPEGRVVRVKPEHDDLEALAKKLNISLREAIDLVERELARRARTYFDHNAG